MTRRTELINCAVVNKTSKERFFKTLSNPVVHCSKVAEHAGEQILLIGLRKIKGYPIYNESQ